MTMTSLNRRPRPSAMLGALGALAVSLALPHAALADTEECHTVELVPDGMSYHVNNGIAGNGHDIRFVPFTTGGGQSLRGSATILTRAVNGTAVKGLELKDIAVRHASGAQLSRVVVRYADFGGGVNLRIGGALLVADRLGSLTGRQVGDVSIAVQEVQSGSARVGTMRLDGPISSLAVGGRGLLLREACGRSP